MVSGRWPVTGQRTGDSQPPLTPHWPPTTGHSYATFRRLTTVRFPMLTPMIVAALVLRQQTETWSFKPSFDPKNPKEVWGTIVDAQSDDQAHHATFQFTRTTKSSDKTKTVVTFNWEKLAVDNQEGQDLPGWDAVMGARGEILKMDTEADDNYRRMLSPMVFVYPEKAVAIGDKWSSEVKPSGNGAKLTYSYEAKSKEKVDGENTLVIAATFKESGENPVSGNGTWWLSKVGKVVKFEMKLTNWVVPMAGSDVTDVVLKAKAQ